MMRNWSKRRLIHYQKRKQEAIEYIRECFKQRYFPSYNELNKKFGIRYLKITTAELYSKVGINFLEMVNIKRPDDCIPKIRKELIDYLKREVSQNHYPSRREIESKFHLKLATKLFGGIKDLYKKAGINYKQENNQELKVKKAEILNNIVLSFLPKLNLELVNVCGICERGIDMLTEDKDNNLVGIELKAYNKYEMVKKRNIEQIKKWLLDKKFSKIILVTTTSKIQNNIEIPKNLEIIKFEDLIKMCDKRHLKSLDYIRNHSIHIDTDQHKKKRDMIKNYVVKNYKDTKRIKINEINRILRLDTCTYFKNQLELYKYCNIFPPLNLIRGRNNKDNNKVSSEYFQIWESKIINYIKEEVVKGRYPSNVDINKEFNIVHIWNYFKMSDLYRKAGYKPYHERLC